MTAVMRLSDVSLARGGRTLFSGLDCEVHSGQVTVVLGPNGAGKSSLLLALAGLIPAEGRIEIEGKRLQEYPRGELPRLVAWQGELPPTEFGLTVAQRLRLAAPEAEDMTPVLKQLDLTGMQQRPLGALSSGERQRVELAAVMLRDCPIWLLDEPTAHLDLKHQVRCIRMLMREGATGRAIVTVLHDIQQARAVADRVVLVDGRGGVVYGAAEALLNCARLSALFAAPLVAREGFLMPDYTGDS